MIDRRALMGLLGLGLAGCGGAATNERAADPPMENVSAADASAAANQTQPQPAVVATAPSPEPIFTSLRRSECQVLEENREEGAYARYLCPGRDERKLEVIEADAREDLAVRGADGRAASLRLPSTIAGGAFSTLGDTVEWIGPDRLVVRYGVYEQSDGQRPTSYLLVVDLAEATPCVLAKLPPGDGQNEEARARAEDPARGVCLNRG